MIPRWARILAPLALLAACTTGMDGRPVAVRSLAGGAALEFREVVTAVAAPSRLARQPGRDLLAACATYAEHLKGRSAPAAQLVTEAKACRQHPGLPADQTAQQAAFATLDCTRGATDPLAGNADPKLPLATCDRDSTAQYVLNQAFLTGRDLTDAQAQVNTQGIGWVVMIDFTSNGSRLWADFTTKNVNKQVAFVLDGAVVSAPTIQEPITGGQTQIMGGGGGFSQEEAQRLVDRLNTR